MVRWCDADVPFRVPVVAGDVEESILHGHAKLLHITPGNPTLVDLRALTDRVDRHAGRARGCSDPAPTRGTRLTRSPQPTLTLVQLRRHRPEPLTDRELIDHTPTVLHRHRKTC